jgi:hypothetical protein
MILHYLYTKRKWDGFLTLIVAIKIPNWFERWFLLKREEQIRWVGHGKKWAILDKDVHTVPLRPWFDRFLIRRLEAIEGGVDLDFNRTRKKGHTYNKGIKVILVLILFGVLTSCSVAKKVVHRQKQLQAESSLRHPKPSAKKNPKKSKAALAISISALAVWLSALDFFGSFDPYNRNSINP